MDSVKICIIIRKDLQMRKGKFCSQACHSFFMAILNIMNLDNNRLILDFKKYPIVKKWIEEGQTKITLYCESEKELLEIYQNAKNKNINCSIVTDAGKTEFNGISTKTAICIGPDYSKKIDEITGHLKLL